LPKRYPKNSSTGSRIDHFAELEFALDVAIIGVHHDLDVRMIQHVLEHPRVPMQRHGWNVSVK
jgi:hypothetical protein